MSSKSKGERATSSPTENEGSERYLHSSAICAWRLCCITRIYCNDYRRGGREAVTGKVGGNRRQISRKDSSNEGGACRILPGRYRVFRHVRQGDRQRDGCGGYKHAFGWIGDSIGPSRQQSLRFTQRCVCFLHDDYRLHLLLSPGWYWFVCQTGHLTAMASTATSAA